MNSQSTSHFLDLRQSCIITVKTIYKKIFYHCTHTKTGKDLNTSWTSETWTSKSWTSEFGNIDFWSSKSWTWHKTRLLPVITSVCLFSGWELLCCSNNWPGGCRNLVTVARHTDAWSLGWSASRPTAGWTLSGEGPLDIKGLEGQLDAVLH